MKIDTSIEQYIDDHKQEAYDLLLELARIPAPSNHEEKRAQFCKTWLEKQGAKGVYIDEALNVVYPIGCREDKPLAVFMAHSDVVFPDTEELPLTVSDGFIHCPGIGDDTGNVAALMTAAKYITVNGLESKDWGILLVINSGEEGLGNLKGVRKIFEVFGHRVKEFVTFDLNASSLYTRAVGSRRYRIEAITKGGHSLNDFGSPNSIAVLSSMVYDLYKIQVPKQGRTTYNVGTIQGGTSVNTIAQQAEMLFEFRSDDRDSLEQMQKLLDEILEKHRTEDVKISCTVVGDRPCGAPVDEQAQTALADRATAAVEQWFGVTPVRKAASTDCNIPLSMGIPSICTGCLTGYGAHTREEKVEIASLHPGLKVCFHMVLHHF